LLDRYDNWARTETEYAYADGIDQAMLVRTGDGYGVEDLYAVVGDHLGSMVTFITDHGEVWLNGDYHPFGDPLIAYPFGDWLTTLGFTGREYDYDIGLYYYRNRWYSTDLGRFLEPDPIGLAGMDINLYRYVKNGPLSWLDPFGLCEEARDPNDPQDPVDDYLKDLQNNLNSGEDMFWELLKTFARLSKAPFNVGDIFERPFMNLIKTALNPAKKGLWSWLVTHNPWARKIDNLLKEFDNWLKHKVMDPPGPQKEKGCPCP